MVDRRASCEPADGCINISDHSTLVPPCKPPSTSRLKPLSPGKAPTSSTGGDEAFGESRAYPKPIFSFRDRHFTGLFSTNYIKFAQEYPEVPRLTPQQREALELFGVLADELALNMSFEPGDIQA
jgi:hypothetical protein